VAVSSRRAMVALSGGVDSSTAAALLLQQGFEVAGAVLVHGDYKIQEAAQKAARHLQIPLYVYDIKELFGKVVVSYFLESYLKGETPNPCVICNLKIRFGFLLERAQELGFPFLATGHYARCLYHEGRRRYLLAKGRDKAKDQSYFLYGLKQEQLRHILFPLGEYTKGEVREMAQRWGLPGAQARESQDICFIRGDYRRFLRERAGDRIKPGPILDVRGRLLGYHQGLPFYTVGQRRGLGLGSGKPYFVLGWDVQRNALIVGEEGDLKKMRVLFSRENNYILWEEPPPSAEITAKVRYRGKETAAFWYNLGGGRARVEFADFPGAMAPGQSVVYYQGEWVVGGGIIEGYESEYGRMACRL